MTPHTTIPHPGSKGLPAEKFHSGSADRWPASTDPVRGAGLVRPSGSRPDCPAPSMS
jgi:hypothetical protein